MSEEIELKLEVPPDALDRLMDQDWVKRSECDSTRQLSTYYDTPKKELRKRGYTLRVRSVGERFVQTVKLLDHGAGLFERGEWEHEIKGPKPDAARLAKTPLSGLDVKRLKPVIASDVNRTACRLMPDGAEIELDIDRGMILAAGREEPVSEIEIELVKGEASLAVEIAKRIADHVPVKLGVLSKAERGFALADGKSDKVSKAEAVPVDERMTVAEGFAAIAGACVRHFRLNEAAVIERRDPAALHQARVAMRRLRATMSLFRTAIADSELQRIRGEARWFTGELGDARNLDVYLERDLFDGDRAALSRRREVAYDRVVKAIDSSRFRALMLDLAAWAALGEWRKHANAGMPLEPYVNLRIDRLWAKIDLSEPMAVMDEEERHRLRIDVKKFRYALEFVEALHVHEHRRKKKFMKSVQDLQEMLGQLNDAAVARTIAPADALQWAPDESAEDEQRLVKRADRALERLRKTGPYWRR